MVNPMEMLGGLKSRLGLGARNYAGEYDEYDDYDEYGDYDDYDDYADDGYRSYDNGYDDYQSDRYSRRNSRSRDVGYDRERDRYSNRNVVTTRSATPSSTNSYGEARQTSRSASYASPRTSAARTMVDSSIPASLTPEGYAATSAAASRKRSEGLDSLFASTAGDSQSPAADLPVIGVAANDGEHAGAHAKRPSDSLSANLNSQRQLVVMRPNDYNDVESVARTLKSGDAVVLSLKLTPEGLFKRILDFSFGVASALDANVECIGDKVFSITCETGLTDTEMSTLRAQGVIV